MNGNDVIEIAESYGLDLEEMTEEEIEQMIVDYMTALEPDTTEERYGDK